jgi:hypothetical protein
MKRTPAIVRVIAKNFMRRSLVLEEEGGKVTKVQQSVKRKRVGRIGII